MRQHVIALVDCDCFFVSCERKDNPDLQGKPVCVMTSGGSKGIIVSRSKEAKACQLRMEIGLSTLEEECASQGLDWEEVLEQRLREKNKLTELGLYNEVNKFPLVEIEKKS